MLLKSDADEQLLLTVRAEQGGAGEQRRSRGHRGEGKEGEASLRACASGKWESMVACLHFTSKSCVPRSDSFLRMCGRRCPLSSW